jgi:hypothetical protein
VSTQNHQKPILLVAGLLALMALTTLACSFSGAGVSKLSPVVDITWTDDMLGWAEGAANFRNVGRSGDWYIPFHNDGEWEGLLDEVTHIEMHDGYLRFVGSKDREAGSFDLSLGAVDGALKAKIVAVAIPGIEMSSPVVVEANRELERALTEVAADLQGEVIFKEVEVKEGSWRMKVQVDLDTALDFEPEIDIEF